MQRIQRLLNRESRPEEPRQNRIFVPMINAGMMVNEDTAMQFSAVFRAVGYISSMLGMMPWRVMNETANGKDLMATHPVDRLLHRRPNPEMSPFTFRETLISHALTWGNGYAEIERDAANRPSALWIVSPDRVEVRREDGRLVYEISNTREGKSYVSAENMFHLHGLGFDGNVGYSVINMARRGIGLGMAAEQTGASLFENGLMTNLVIEHPDKLGEQAYKNLKDSLFNYLKGPKRAGYPLVTEEGMQVKNLTMPMDDAQFLETRQFQVEEIARWFGLPPHKLQSLDKATFSNIEQQSIEVVTDALQPWATRLEQEANYKLFNQRSNFYTKLNMNSLLRGDMKARSEFYREMWNLGVLSINEIREFEDMNPVPDGDKRFVQLNMTTLEKAGEDPEPAPETEIEEDDEDVVETIAMKIVRREAFRLTDAMRRYHDDRDAFIRWMVSFFDQHLKYCMAKFLEASINPPDFVTHRVVDARLRMLEHFDDGIEYPEEKARDEIIRSCVRKSA